MNINDAEDDSEHQELDLMKGDLEKLLGKNLMDKVYALIATNVRYCLI
jgi:hypothetical protein